MSSTIHVGNLSFNLREEDLQEFFSKYGKVVDCYIVKRNGRPKGYGFVEFSSTQEADNAVGANNLDLQGRSINVEPAKGKIIKSNFVGTNPLPPRRYNNDRPPRRDDDRFNNGPRRDDDRFNNGPRRDDNGPRRDNNGPRRDDNGPRRDDNGPRRDNNGPRRDDNGPPRRYNYSGPRNSMNNASRNMYYLNTQNVFGNRRFNNGPRRNGPPRRNPRPQVEKEKSLTTVYVSNLPFSFDENQLANIFSKFKVKTSHVVQTRNGRSRGYGFVEFETEQDQLNAFKSMDQATVTGTDGVERNINVKVALIDRQGGDNKEEKTD